MSRASDKSELQGLQAALAKISKDKGAGTIIDLSGQKIEKVKAIKTGSLSLDIALGIGGLPVGRIIEVYGPESSGKTTLCYHVIAAVQKDGGVAAFIDAEHSMDPAYAQNLGVDLSPDKLVFSQPDTGEDALEIAELLIKSGDVNLVVIDSVAALTPKAEIEGEIGDSLPGIQARMMSKALRKIKGEANQRGCTLLFTNQLREKIGVMFGNPETQPGGKALKFYASVRLDIRRIETLKEGGEAYGNKVRVKVVKNKVAAPFKQAEFDIIYGDGFDRFGIIRDEGVKYEVIEKSGNTYSYKGERLGTSKATARDFLKENQEITDQIEAELFAKLGITPAGDGDVAPLSEEELAEDAAAEDKVVAEVESGEADEIALD